MWKHRFNKVFTLALVLTLLIPLVSATDTVTLDSPADNYTEIADSLPTIGFEYTPDMDGNISQGTLYLYLEDGSLYDSQNNASAVVDGGSNTINYEFTDFNIYLWNVGVTDESGETFAAANRTVKIGSDQFEFNEEQSVEAEEDGNEQDEFNDQQSVVNSKTANDQDEYNPTQTVSVTYGTDFWLFQNYANNETKEGLPCLISVDIIANGTLNHAILSTNKTGTWVNETAVALTGGQDTAETTITLPTPAGTLFQYKWYANNTDGDAAVSTAQSITTEGVLETEDVTIVNVEPCGEYVFVGRKEYEFTVEVNIATNYSNYQIGLGFYDDAGDWYSFTYSNTTDRTTVVAPDDGVSGTCRSVTESGNDKTASFYLMFHDPVADSINTSIYIRALGGSDDTGWNDTEEDFSIYNIGGVTTLTSSGWAGREDGADAFEIYAADTRTPVLIDNYGFEIRDKPTWKAVEDQLEFIENIGEDWIVHSPYILWDTGSRLAVFPMSAKPDSNLAGGPSAGNDDRSYNEGRWGLYIIDEDTSSQRKTYIEKAFRREIDSDNDEIVYVQWYLMCPWVGNSTDPGAGGEVRILDSSDHTDNERIAVQIRFNSTGYLEANNRTVGWTSLQAVSDYTWYNVTAVVNVTSQTFDVYVDDVLKADNFDFADNQCTELAYVWIGRSNTNVNFNEFWCDDVSAWTDFSGNYGGWAEVKTVHKNLQQWHMDFDWKVDSEQYVQGPSWLKRNPIYGLETFEEEGYILLGWDVCINGSWSNDLLYANITIKDGFVSQQNNWVLFNVDWYNYDDLVASETLYGLFEGYSGVLTNEGSSNVIGWHWDIWFNQMDSSTWIGARLNTEYFGVSDKHPLIFFWTNNWQPMTTDRSYTDCFVRLKEDGSNTVRSVKEVSLIRSWAYIYRTNVSTFHYKIANLEGQMFSMSTAEFSGIETPPITPTKVPVTQGGFLTSMLGGILKRVMESITTTLTYGALNVWNYFVGFMDTLAAWAGYPNYFSNLLSYLSSFVGWIGNMMSWSIELFKGYYLFMNKGMSKFLTVITTSINIWVDMLDLFFDFLNGVYTDGIQLYEDFGGAVWIKIGALLYPMWLIELWDRKGSQALLDHLQFVFNMGALLLTTMLGVAEFAFNLISRLIEAIPVIE